MVITSGLFTIPTTRVRVTFDVIPVETPDKFSLTGHAEGINLQIMDNYGYPARAGKSMPPQILSGRWT